MTILKSDSFAGAGTASISARTLDNALGGSGTVAWQSQGPANFFGDGAGALNRSSAGNNFASVPGADSFMMLIDPNGDNVPSPGVSLRRSVLTGTNDARVTAMLSASGQTALQIREHTGASSTTQATTAITAPVDPYWLKIHINPTTDLVTASMLDPADMSVINSVTWAPGSLPAGDLGGFQYIAGGSTLTTFDSAIFEEDDAGAPPAGTVTIASVTPGDTTASVVYSYDDTDQTGFEYRLDGGTPAAIGASPATITGLTASTTYDIEVRAINADGNGAWSAVESFTTTTPDTTAPTLSSPTATALSNALIAAGVTTDEANGTLYVVATTSATPPTAAQIRAGQDHTGSAAVFADDQVISSTGAKTFNVTGLTQLTLYYLYFHHQDAAGNNSTVSSASATTFRNGATAQSVIDNTAAIGGNPAGVLYALALTLDPDDWMAYREISAPDPAGGTLTANANGSFTYVGPEPADWVIQPEVNGVDHADGTITVALYQTIIEDTTAPTLTSPTGATLGPTGAVGSVSTNEANGTLYWLTNTSATATDAAIKAGSSQAVTTTGVQNVTSSGLTASTLYYNHFLHRDAAGNDSARSTSASFTTAAPGGPATGSDHGGTAMRSAMRPAMYSAINKG